MNKAIKTALLAGIIAAGLFVLGRTFAGTGPSEPADDFSLPPASGGQAVSLAKLKGKPALVVFWATWCPPCRREIPTLKDIQAKYGPKGLQLLAVAIDYRQTREQVVQFQKDNQLPYSVLWDEGNKVSEHYGVYGIPTLVLVDPQGVIRFRGNQVDDSVMALLDQYTKAK